LSNVGATEVALGLIGRERLVLDYRRSGKGGGIRKQLGKKGEKRMNTSKEPPY